MIYLPTIGQTNKIKEWIDQKIIALEVKWYPKNTPEQLKLAHWCYKIPSGLKWGFAIKSGLWKLEKMDFNF
jgi:arsenate reductase-like glutaredoxin family protein